MLVLKVSVLERVDLPTSMSESSLRIIVLPLLIYPYFRLDIEQDEICKALFIKQH